MTQPTGVQVRPNDELSCATNPISWADMRSSPTIYRSRGQFEQRQLE